MNLPNKITLSRIALIPIFVTLYYFTFIPHNLLYSVIVFAIASFTDFLDGYIARKYNLVTDLGKFLDPIADKVLVLIAFMLMLTNVNGGVLYVVSGGIGVSIIITRELIVSSFRMVAASKNMVIAADKLGKIKTVSQDVSIVVLLVSKSFACDFCTYLFYVGYAIFIFSVLMTVISGVSYVYKNRKVITEI